MITRVIVYRCTLCERDSDTPVAHCKCENKMSEGDAIGPFIILEVLKNSYFKIECCICGLVKEIHQSNIKRQDSCGCKPRHIDMKRVTSEQIMYTCRKCRQVTSTNLPIEEWCCDD